MFESNALYKSMYSMAHDQIVKIKAAEVMFLM